MGIQIYRDYLGISSYQNYYKPEMKTVHTEETQDQDMKESIPESAPSSKLYSSFDRKTGNIGLENISLTFRKENSFDYIGSESSLESLDIRKAVSDMRKDSILQEYQYFVGGAQGILKNTQDGIVIPKF